MGYCSSKKSSESLDELEARVRTKLNDCRIDQSHVFAFVNILNETEKRNLFEQLDNLGELNALVDIVLPPSTSTTSPIISSATATTATTPMTGATTISSKFTVEEISPIVDCLRVQSEADEKKYWEIGKMAIAEGKVACCVLAGGQGTRLGFDGPKGMFPIFQKKGTDRESEQQISIFQLQAEQICRLQTIAGGIIPFCIMTSPLNDAITKEFFANNNYFGLDQENVHFFEQTMKPCFDFEGKLLMDSVSHIATAPDGNGAVYCSLENSGVLQSLEDRGCLYLHIFSVDNILVKIADPIYIGYMIETNAEVCNKVVWKENSEEKVGVMVNVSNKAMIIEYSEMESEVREEIDVATGKLKYGAGNICNHLFTIPFIKEKVLKNLVRSYHFAKKKIPHIQYPDATLIHPDVSNGIKLEMFIFDSFYLSSKTTLIEVERAEEFAPVKNAPGADSDTVAHAVQAYSRRCLTWLESVEKDLQYVPEKRICKEGKEKDDTSSVMEDRNDSPLILLSPLQCYSKVDNNILKDVVSSGSIKIPYIPVFNK